MLYSSTYFVVKDLLKVDIQITTPTEHMRLAVCAAGLLCAIACLEIESYNIKLSYFKADIKNIKQAKEEIKLANKLLERLKLIFDVNNNKQDELVELGFNSDPKIKKIKKEIDDCLNSVTSARKELKKQIPNIDDLQLYYRAQSVLNDINDCIKKLKVCKHKFFTNFGEIFKEL
jgi:hypothetical protein